MLADNLEIYITEKRAPTDESIRLATEFQQKAIDSIIGTKRVDVNGIAGELAVFKTPWNDEVLFCLIYNINGKRHYFKASVNSNEAFAESYDLGCLNRGAYLCIFARKFSEHLAASILNNVKFDNMSW